MKVYKLCSFKKISFTTNIILSIFNKLNDSKLDFKVKCNIYSIIGIVILLGSSVSEILLLRYVKQVCKHLAKIRMHT